MMMLGLAAETNPNKPLSNDVINCISDLERDVTTAVMQGTLLENLFRNMMTLRLNTLVQSKVMDMPIHELLCLDDASDVNLLTSTGGTLLTLKPLVRLDIMNRLPSLRNSISRNCFNYLDQTTYPSIFKGADGDCFDTLLILEIDSKTNILDIY